MIRDGFVELEEFRSVGILTIVNRPCEVADCYRWDMPVGLFRRMITMKKLE